MLIQTSHRAKGPDPLCVKSRWFCLPPSATKILTKLVSYIFKSSMPLTSMHSLPQEKVKMHPPIRATKPQNIVDLGIWEATEAALSYAETNREKPQELTKGWKAARLFTDQKQHVCTDTKTKHTPKRLHHPKCANTLISEKSLFFVISVFPINLTVFLLVCCCWQYVLST